MRLLKKIFVLATFLFFTVSGIFAMPGFSSFIKDSSGEFVYYRDYSFPDESYIGLLYYAEDSIQIRYYRPLNKEKMIPEKEISILFSINPELDYFELTGELIMSTILPETEDVDIVNYLHDILYEFSARRIKEGDISPAKNAFTTATEFLSSGTKSQQSYEQFGGTVTIVFDPLIPIFNVKSIYNNSNKPVFSCVTFGILQNSADSTFDDFTGFSEEKFTIHKESSIKKNLKATDYATTDNQYITLDSNWSQAMDNLWLCGNESLLTINSIPSKKDDSINYDFSVLRKLLQSANGSYTNLSKCEIIKDTKKDAYKIIQTSYQPKTENIIVNRKIITRNPITKGFYYFALTVFNEYYYQNSAYYDRIIKSYKIKN